MATQADIDENFEATARVGRTLRDKWHLDALIDVGGMAAVYAATHRNGLRGAVKILHQHRSVDPDIASRFRREGYIANKVAHPNAVRVLDDDVDDDGSVFLVMELLQGSTLRERAVARGGRLSVDEVLLAMDQLLDVLAVTHDVGIVHRDVKPENVFVSADGQVKILDFGIARLADSTPAAHSETISGMPMGSPSFMSPEQARGRWDLVDAQSDLWSVGATMFNLLSGEDVHAARTVPELLAEIFTTQARSLATALPDCHPALTEIVDRALQLRLADRWPEARAMQNAVRSAYREIFGVHLPRRSFSSPELARPISFPSIRLDDGAPRGVTTVLARVPQTARKASMQRIAAMLVLLVAGGVCVEAWSRDSRSQEPPPAEGLVAELAELGEAAAVLPATPARPSVPTTVATTAYLPERAAAAATIAPPSKLGVPASRPRRAPIYDRRY